MIIGPFGLISGGGSGFLILFTVQILKESARQGVGSEKSVTKINFYSNRSALRSPPELRKSVKGCHQSERTKIFYIFLRG